MEKFKEVKRLRKKKEVFITKNVREILPGVTLDPLESELPIVEVKTLKGKPYTEIVFMGDFHLGSGGFSAKQFTLYRDFILRERNRKVILMGDLLDLTSLSPYAAAEKQRGSIQIEELIYFLEPIKKRIIASVEGNHEKRFWRATKGSSVTKRIFAELGIKPLVRTFKQRIGSIEIEEIEPERGLPFILRVVNKDEVQDYSMYVIHGSGAAQKQIFNYLEKHYLNNPTFSLLAMGHLHRIATQHKVNRQIRWLNGKYHLMMTEQRWLITGSFVKYLGYAEEKAYPLTKIGAPVVRFYVNKNAMEVIDPLVTYDVGYKPDPFVEETAKFWNFVKRLYDSGKDFEALEKIFARYKEKKKRL